jgi:hypothetical protein
VAKRTFGRVDDQIWKNVWKWARRRHPGKGKPWCKKRYFQRVGSRDWEFTPAQGEGKLRLIRASDTPIRCHIKIRKDAILSTQTGRGTLRSASDSRKSPRKPYQTWTKFRIPYGSMKQRRTGFGGSRVLERLELPTEKFARAVLRGRGFSNEPLLLDWRASTGCPPEEIRLEPSG